jgi:hypothetical protein
VKLKGMEPKIIRMCVAIAKREKKKGSLTPVKVFSLRIDIFNVENILE